MSEPLDDKAAVELLARQWRENRRDRSEVPLHPYLEAVFIQQSEAFAREALRQLKEAGIEMVLTEQGRASLEDPDA